MAADIYLGPTAHLLIRSFADRYRDTENWRILVLSIHKHLAYVFMRCSETVSVQYTKA